MIINESRRINESIDIKKIYPGTKVKIKKTGKTGYVESTTDDKWSRGVRVIYDDRPGMYPDFYTLDEIEIINESLVESFNEDEIRKKLDNFQSSITVNAEDENKMKDLLFKKNISFMIDDSIPGKRKFNIKY